MVQIPEYTPRGQLETATSPLVDTNFLTDEYRALAQLGKGFEALGNVLHQMEQQNQARMLVENKADWELQAAEITNNYANDEWAKNKFGDDYTTMASEQMREYKALSERISSEKLTGLNKNSRASWDTWMKSTQAQLSLRANTRQVQFHEQQMKLSFFRNIEARKADVLAGKMTPEQAMVHIDDYAKQLPEGIQLEAEVWKRSAKDQLDAVAANRLKAIEIIQAKVLADAIIATGGTESEMRLAVAISDLPEKGKKLADAQVSRFIAAKDAKTEEDQRESTTTAAQAALNGVVPEGFNTIEDYLSDRVTKEQMTPAQSDTWLDNYYDNMARKAKGKPIVPNTMARGELDDDVNDVGRGVQTFDEAADKWRLAFFGRINKIGKREYVYNEIIGNAPLISEDQYVKGITDTGNVFDKQTEDAIRIRNFEARELLLGAETASLDISTAAGQARARAISAGRGETEEHLELRTEAVADYKDEMREWVRFNADRIKKEGIGIFYSHAAQRKQDYRKDLLDVISKNKGKKGGGLEIERFVVPYRPKSQREFDLIPSGSPIELPNGNIGLK